MSTEEGEQLEEAQRKVAAVASFAALSRGELPDGRPLMEMAMLEAAGKLWDANRGRNVFTIGVVRCERRVFVRRGR
jgi:hypothetical protein